MNGASDIPTDALQRADARAQQAADAYRKASGGIDPPGGDLECLWWGMVREEMGLSADLGPRIPYSDPREEAAYLAIEARVSQR